MSAQYIEIDRFGDKFYYKDKKMTIPHREDGPACEYANGSKFWFICGELHQEDGPAVEYGDGTKEWYIDGKELSEEKFNARKNSCNGKIVEIDGKKYKLTELK
jgi:hypothetical protein